MNSAVVHINALTGSASASAEQLYAILRENAKKIIGVGQKTYLITTDCQIDSLTGLMTK